MSEHDIEVCKQAIEKYGIKNQLVKTVEELSELTKALCKYFECTDKRMEPIILDAIDEEMADVEIMMRQLKMIFRNEEQIEARHKEKIDRLERRIKGGIYGV